MEVIESVRKYSFKYKKHSFDVYFDPGKMEHEDNCEVYLKNAGYIHFCCVGKTFIEQQREDCLKLLAEETINSYNKKIKL